MMNDICRDLIAEGIMVVYLDDILIFTRTEEEHTKAIRRVLQVLQEHKLFLCPEKCEFCKERIEYLGLVISENKVSMDPVKVTGVHEWPTPENKMNVQAFLGFVNFYRRFIRDFSTKARPLFNLTCSERVWTWSGKEQMAFKDVTNFIWSYLHQFSIDSHILNGYGKPLKRPFDRYQSRLEAINNGRDIRQIN